MTALPPVRGNQRGFALFSTFLLLLLLVTVGSATIFYSVLDLKSTTHYNTGNQAFLAAEAGIQHALSSMNSIGVLDFNQDVVQRWSTVYGSEQKTVPGYPSVSYQASVAADATDPVNLGSISATGFAPAQAKRVLTVRLRKGSGGKGDGALLLAADSVGTDFSGNSFLVDGKNYDTFGNLVPGGTAHPGISTRNDGVTSAVVGSLSDEQKANVQGLGFSTSPLTPSVVTTGGPSATDLNRMVNDILARPGVVNDDTHNVNNGDVKVFGTVAAPQITHLTNTDVTVNGSIVGAGILIADGSIDITGTINFIGWIIVHGETVIHTKTADDGTTVLGNATIRGSLWTADFDLKVGGSASVKYCDECLRLAGNNNNYPRPMQVSSWQEVL